MYWQAALTALVAAWLTQLPTPDWAAPVWPAWLLLTVVYWCIALPDRFGVLFAWLAGIFADLLEGGLLGQNALGYTLVAYLAILAHQRLRAYPSFQQIPLIALLLLPHWLLSVWIDAGVRGADAHWRAWTPLAASALAWPWVYSMMRMIRQRAAGARHGVRHGD